MTAIGMFWAMVVAFMVDARPADQIADGVNRVEIYGIPAGHDSNKVVTPEQALNAGRLDESKSKPQKTEQVQTAGERASETLTLPRDKNPINRDIKETENRPKAAQEAVLSHNAPINQQKLFENAKKFVKVTLPAARATFAKVPADAITAAKTGGNKFVNSETGQTLAAWGQAQVRNVIQRLECVLPQAQGKNQLTAAEEEHAEEVKQGQKPNVVEQAIMESCGLNELPPWIKHLRQKRGLIEILVPNTRGHDFESWNILRFHAEQHAILLGNIVAALADRLEDEHQGKIELRSRHQERAYDLLANLVASTRTDGAVQNGDFDERHYTIQSKGEYRVYFGRESDLPEYVSPLFWQKPTILNFGILGHRVGH